MTTDIRIVWYFHGRDVLEFSLIFNFSIAVTGMEAIYKSYRIPGWDRNKKIKENFPSAYESWSDAE